MLEKHPQGPPPTIPEGNISTPPLQLSASQVTRGIRSFKAGSAPGPSGLRAEHLKEALSALSPASAGKAASALQAFVNLLSSGNIPPLVVTYFCGAKLYASIKKDDTFRPSDI